MTQANTMGSTTVIDLLSSLDAPPVNPEATMSDFINGGKAWRLTYDTGNWEAYLKAIGMPWILRKLPGVVPPKGLEPDFICSINDDGCLVRSYFDRSTGKNLGQDEIFQEGDVKKSSMGSSWTETTAWGGGMMSKGTPSWIKGLRAETRFYVSGTTFVDLSFSVDEEGCVATSYLAYYTCVQEMNACPEESEE